MSGDAVCGKKVATSVAGGLYASFAMKGSSNGSRTGILGLYMPEIIVPVDRRSLRRSVHQTMAANKHIPKTPIVTPTMIGVLDSCFDLCEELESK